MAARPSSSAAINISYIMKNETKKQIINMLKIDQQAISDFTSNKLTRVDWLDIVVNNTKNIISIFNKHGVAKLKSDGKDVYEAMLVLVLHSGDVDFMTNFLNKLVALPEEEFLKSDIAYITDKICSFKKLPQLYGTQYKVINGKNFFLPIADISKVNHLRANVKLPPIIISPDTYDFN